jgi:predicted permease
MLTVLTQAWQSWKSAKAIALLSIVALAIGIGSTTAIYTVVNAVMLKPLPYTNDERWVSLFGGQTNDPERISALPFPDCLEYQRRARSFDAFGWYKMVESFNLTSQGGEPQHVNGAAVTPSLAHTVGVNPIAGQWFKNETEAVISSGLWRRLGGDTAIIGKTITLNGRAYTVTGVMPPGFRLPVVNVDSFDARNDVWVGLDPNGRGVPRDAGYFIVYARLKPGVTLAQAEADVQSIAADIARADPASHPGYTARIWSLRKTVFNEIRPTLLLLFAAAALLLLITCANVAGLLLARSVARARETAVRVALGASRGRLALQYFVEGLIVSLGGAAAGLLVAFAIVRAILAIAADFIPRANEISFDWTVAAFVVATACFASMLMSLAPLWQATRTQPNDVLTDGVRASAGARTRNLSRSLVVAELALAFTLLAVSAVLIHHLRDLRRVSPGFDVSNLLTFELTMPETITSAGEKRVRYQLALLESLRNIPGVVGADYSNQIPLDGCCLASTIYPEGRQIQATGDRVAILPISPGYFQTMRIPLRRGRLLTDHDANNEFLMVVINEATVRRYWPDADAIGAWGRLGSPKGSRFQIVGVVGDVRNDGLMKPVVPEIYFVGHIMTTNPMRFVVRSPMRAEALVPLIRRAVYAVDTQQPIYNIITMQDVLHGSLTFQRAGSFIMAFFAGAALLLAILGVYGVMSYSVRQRTVEIGTRMALGAVDRDLISLVLGGGVKMAVYGLMFGFAGVIGAAWLLMQYLNIREIGAVPFVVSALIIGTLAVTASLFPAWRAIRLSPLAAMRDEPGAIWRSADRRREVEEGAPPRLINFGDAARTADSFAQALESAIERLRKELGASSATLLRNVADYPFLMNRLKAYGYPLPVSQADMDTWLRWAQEEKPQHTVELERLRASGVRLAASLRTNDEIIGILLMGAPDGRDRYTFAERETLRHAVQQLALMLENARLTDRVVEQEKLRRDLALAAEVQKRLLPEKPPVGTVAGVSAVSVPARTIGGDYYDFIETGDHRIGIALADIAGKGVAAALIMSVVQASLRIICSEAGITLPQIAAKLNRYLHQLKGGTSSYATFFYAQLDEQTRRLRYVNAGHNPPYLFRKEQIHELAAGGTVIGLFPQMAYQEDAVDLQSGDLLVAFTDGVTEAQDPSEEEFGEERLKELIRSVAHLPVHEISERISSELRNWIKDAAQYDDLTFIVLKVN